jgi:bacterioferritin
MKGHQKIIDSLNDLLSYELTAIDQYFLHSRMYEDWGLKKLYERIDHEVEDEKGHASALMERILFLEGKPDITKRKTVNIGDDVPSMLQFDLDVEYAVGEALKDVMALCEVEKDYQTREILQKLLEDTEIDHTYWLEQQLGLIKRIGLQNYLQSQMGE